MAAFVVHHKSVGAVKPRDYFADFININYKPAVNSPEYLRVQILLQLFERTVAGHTLHRFRYDKHHTLLNVGKYDVRHIRQNDA